MKMKLSEVIFQGMILLLFTVLVIACIYPFYYILIYSLSDSGTVGKSNMWILPVNFTLDNYKQIILLPGIFNAFLISIMRVVVGSIITIFASSIFAYTLTKNELPARKFFYRMVVISMYLNAGLIPWYIVMIKMGMKNNVLLYILPSAVTAFFLILIKTFMEQLPPSLEESAKLDGANHFTIYMKIIMPLCKPIIAAIAVFSAVNQWNSWADNFFLINNTNLQTLQLTLLNFLRQAEAIANQVKAGASMQGVTQTLSPLSIKMTLTMVVALPIIMVYPFMQKYFVKGIMIGAVKG